MKTKTILSIAIMLALPFGAMAENISGDMYAAPASATQNNPAPTTNASAPYGRIDIDTTDKNHIASTAYVKGAYNSAIAAVNKLDADKVGYAWFDDSMMQLYNDTISPIDERISALENAIEDVNGGIDNLGISMDQNISNVATALSNKRVEIYTTWDANNTTQVELSEVRPAQGNN